MNMEEMLSTRHAHEELTTKVGQYLQSMKAMKSISSLQSPVISVRNVLTRKASHADFRTECIPVWKAME